MNGLIRMGQVVIFNKYGTEKPAIVTRGQVHESDTVDVQVFDTYSLYPQQYCSVAGSKEDAVAKNLIGQLCVWPV